MKLSMKLVQKDIKKLFCIMRFVYGGIRMTEDMVNADIGYKFMKVCSLREFLRDGNPMRVKLPPCTNQIGN